MTGSITLPLENSSQVNYQLNEPKKLEITPGGFRSRIAYAAAHVVVDPTIPLDSPTVERLDWEPTLAYRRYLWSLGFAVAEAIDTSQRGMGLDWEAASELIRQSLLEAEKVGGTIACGAGTDHLRIDPNITLSEVIAAYESQVGFVEDLGGRVILMASRALAACARGPADYEKVYGHILKQVRQPVIIHWLGPMFDPQLKGYWGSTDLDEAMQSCLKILNAYGDRIDGIKISLLDADREIRMRRLLPAGVRMYTGDDFNYADLIQGDEQGFSHALLGIFDAIAPVAAVALQALDRNDRNQYQQLMDSTLALSRHIFQQPTYDYKTGIVFLAWLNGHQDSFQMLAGKETARSVDHLYNLFVLADQTGLLRNPELAIDRMNLFLQERD